jgi:pyruvate dehydrogenase E1 component beta subunit
VRNAADELQKEGINAEVIDLRSVRPIDYDAIINSVKKTNRLVMVEEAWPLGNISTEVAFKVQKDAFDFLDAPVLRVTSPDVPMSFSKVFVEAYLPNEAKIISAVKKVMYK